MKRFYLSEMAMSDRHGGGLTMSRILQEDLGNFDRFLHVDPFATQAVPIAERFAHRQLNLHELFPPPRDITGPLYSRFERLLDRLRIKTSFAWSEDFWSRRVAKYILDQIGPDEGRWLIVPQRTASVLVMNRIIRRRPMHYITWVMDDHVIRWRNGWNYPPTFEAEFKFHLQQAKKVFVISPAMQEFYRQRFDVNAEVLFGPADPSGGPVFHSHSGPTRLAYFGAIRAWQRDALAVLVVNLDKIGATLDIFGLQEPPPELRSPLVKILAPVPAHDVPAKMREYDGVVIPASFQDRQRSLTEFNIATKLSECLGSGTVTVIVAPAYAAMVKFVRQHGGALVVSNFDDPAQVGALRNLQSRDLRERLLPEAHRTAQNQCAPLIMRQRWQQAWQAGTDTVTLSSTKPGITA